MKRDKAVLAPRPLTSTIQKWTVWASSQARGRATAKASRKNCHRDMARFYGGGRGLAREFLRRPAAGCVSSQGYSFWRKGPICRKAPGPLKRNETKRRATGCA